MYLEISRRALVRNARAVCEYVGVPVIGVVKCDGYGVTIPEAARAWKQAGASMFAVARPEEATVLREAGFREDILLLSPVADRETLNRMTAQNVILTVTGFENAEFYSIHAAHIPVRVHVAVDTGMGRFGICWEDAEQLRAIYRLPGFSFEGIFSHFSSSFEKTFHRTKLQLNRFSSAVQSLTDAGIDPGIRHMANSCAALRFPETRLDAVRIGSALVGRLCVPVPIALERVGVFRAQVVDCKYFRPGDTTGYASLCRLRRAARAVVVELGQRDGFGLVNAPDKLRLRDLAAWLRHLLRSYCRAPRVCCGSQELPLIGRVGNQHTLFDATGADVQPGDWVSWEGDILFPGMEKRFSDDPAFHPCGR